MLVKSLIRKTLNVKRHKVVKVKQTYSGIEEVRRWMRQRTGNARQHHLKKVA